MRKYEKILLMAALVITLSIISTAISFFHAFTYGWGTDVRPTPEEEKWKIEFTQCGFPYGWHLTRTYTVGGQIEDVTTKYDWGVFIGDTIFYIVMYSLMARLILWLYRLYTSKNQNKTLTKAQK